jgi:hypothetical protein
MDIFISGFQVARSVRKKHQGLSIQSRQSRDSPKAFATCEVEGNNLVPRDTVEQSIGSKAQAARFAELCFAIRRENSDEVAIRRIVFPNVCHRVYSAEWTLAGDNDIAVGCDSEIERTQFGIRDQP